jgi:hypothetical protein
MCLESKKEVTENNFPGVVQSSLCQISFCCGAEFIELHPRLEAPTKSSEEP